MFFKTLKIFDSSLLSADPSKISEITQCALLIVWLLLLGRRVIWDLCYNS